MKSFSLILLIVVVFISCKKSPLEPDILKESYLVEGIMYDKDGKTPLANYPLILLAEVQHSFSPSTTEQVASGSTDENGHFADWGILGNPYNLQTRTLIPCDSAFGAAGSYKRAAKPIEENETAVGINVFPNPSIDNITLTWFAEEEEEVHVKVIEVTGKEVMHKTFVGQEGNNEQQLSIKPFTKGMYFVEIMQHGNKERL